MTKYSGSDLFVTFDATTISDHGASLDVDEEHAAPDVTAFGDNDGTYIPGGVTDRKAVFDGFDDSGGDVYNACPPGASNTLAWYPQGYVAGLPAYSAEAIVTKRSVGFKIRDKVALKIEFQITSTVTVGVVPGGD